MSNTMPKLKFYKITVLIIATIAIICAFGAYYLQSEETIDYRKHIEKYLILLNQDPKNCHYLEQIANSYQSLNDFKQSIHYYEQALENCPDNLTCRFQLGVSLLMIMDRDAAIKNMDKAINGAKMLSNKKLEKMFIESKEDWLKKWNAIKEMEWNK